MFKQDIKPILFCIFLMMTSIVMFGQKINLETYENKAQGFAILSAQYSKDAYFYARQNYFLSNKDHIINNCDSGLISAQMAMVFTDSALYYAHDTCVYAKLLMETVKDNQLIAFQAFNKVKKGVDFQQFNEYSEVSMLRMGGATADAYMVSLIIEMNDFLLGSNEKTRDFTRLESDENSYITMKTLYNNRLGDIRNELTLLDKEKRSVKESELQKLEDRIILLKEEEKKYKLKVENSENKLVTVKNELSEEMLGIVNKDVFTLDKKGFYNEKVPIPTDVVIPNGLVYRIQIGFFAHQLPSAHFEGVFPISSKKIDDTYYRYEAGNFSSYKDAKAAKSSIIEKGYTDSFLIAYFNGVKIPMSQALLKEKESN